MMRSLGLLDINKNKIVALVAQFLKKYCKMCVYS